MNKDAIFSDGTRQFLDPPEPDQNTKVDIKVRTGKDDATEVWLIMEDGRLAMELESATEDFDYYHVAVQLGAEPLHYCFEIQKGEEHLYWSRKGVTEELDWEIPMSVIPGLKVPDWTKGAVMYQILVDRFRNGDPSNDVRDYEYIYIGRPVQGVKDWNAMPEAFDVGRFYGGDLEGVRQKLSYLSGLGIEGIYFNPLFVSPSNHKYDIQDYDYIDPHFTGFVKDTDFSDSTAADDGYPNRNAKGYITRVTDRENLEASNRFFADFVAEAHAKGIRVVIDGVFNHCGSFNKWMDRERIYEDREGYEPGAFVSADSPYRTFFDFADGGTWPYNRDYDGWWGHNTLPKLNYEKSEELENYILQIGRKWVSPPYNCDGWRLDVAADLGHSEAYNHSFWKKFRQAVKEANPDAVILAEHYGDPGSWLQGGEWDTIMNYDAFMEPVTYFLTGMEKHSDGFDPDAIGDGERFRDTILQNMGKMNVPSIYCSLNQLSNHDHSRFLTRTNHKVGRVADLGSGAAGEDVSVPIMRQAIVMQMTWPGAPCVYYADEAGAVGFTDPDSRRTYPWGHEDLDLIDFYRDAIFLRKTHLALKQGSVNMIECGQNLVAYGRFNREEKMAVAINTADEVQSVDLPVWKVEFLRDSTASQVLTTNEGGYSIMPVSREVKNGYLHLDMKPHSAYVITERIHGANI